MDILSKKYISKPIVGDIYSQGNLKILLDDILDEYITKIGHKRNYLYLDVRNAIGVVSAVLAALCCYVSMYYKYEVIKSVVMFSVFSYMLINGISLLISYKEAEKLYYDSFSISTRINSRYEYIILVYLKDKVAPLKYNKSIFDLFDDKGQMDHGLFLSDLEILLKNE